MGGDAKLRMAKAKAGPVVTGKHFYQAMNSFPF